MRKSNIWVEVTTLVIPERNDSSEELSDIAAFLASVDRNIPWHISAFHPDYKLTELTATPQVTLERAYKIGKNHKLNYIYIGNARIDYGENTYCSFCSKVLIEREGFFLVSNNLKEGRCKYCNQPMEGIWQPKARN
jgi:pyruvate formate lyase activating enzyme